MRSARPDRVVRTLTALASFAYFGLWAGAVLVLIGLPVAKAFGGTGADFYYSLELPVAAPTLQTMVQTVWGPAPLMLDEVAWRRSWDARPVLTEDGSTPLPRE